MAHNKPYKASRDGNTALHVQRTVHVIIIIFNTEKTVEIIISNTCM